MRRSAPLLILGALLIVVVTSFSLLTSFSCTFSALQSGMMEDKET